LRAGPAPALPKLRWSNAAAWAVLALGLYCAPEGVHPDLPLVVSRVP